MASDRLNDLQLATLLENMAEGMIVLDQAGIMIQHNRAALRILGVGSERVLGGDAHDSSWQVVNEDLSPVPADELPTALALRTGLPQAGRLLGVRNANGVYRWIDVNATPVLAGGEVERVVLMFRDVTAELELKAQAERREHFLTTTLSGLPCLVAFLDREYIYRYVNATYGRWFDRPLEYWLGRTMTACMGAAAFQSVKPHLDAALRGEEQRFEREMPDLNGGTRFVEVTYYPERGRSGDIQGVYSVLVDVTERVRAAREIQRKETHLKRITNGLPALIGYWDRDLRNVHANDAYAEYFDLAPEKVIGLTAEEVIGRKLFALNRQYMERALAGEAQSFEREIPMRDARMRETLTQYIPDVVDGGVQGFFVIITDISQVKRLERERQSIESQLIYSAKMSSLGEMAAGVAHEINNPVTIIVGLAARLKSHVASGQLAPAELERDLGRIEATGQRIAKIVRGLRAFARDADHEPDEVFDLATVITETCDLCRERFLNHGVGLRASVASHLIVRGRTTQISQILLNLLNNAFDAVQSLADRWIEIEVREVDGWIDLGVVDAGSGIPAEVAEKMMQPFFTTKSVGQGTGLGLSISKGLAEHNGGSLE